MYRVLFKKMSTRCALCTGKYCLQSVQKHWLRATPDIVPLPYNGFFECDMTRIKVETNSGIGGFKSYK